MYSPDKSNCIKASNNTVIITVIAIIQRNTFPFKEIKCILKKLRMFVIEYGLISSYSYTQAFLKQIILYFMHSTSLQKELAILRMDGSLLPQSQFKCHLLGAVTINSCLSSHFLPLLLVTTYHIKIFYCMSSRCGIIF